MEEDDDEEETDENKPQLIVIEPLENDEFHEISTDYLCLKEYDNKNDINNLQLEYLLEDQHYFIGKSNIYSYKSSIRNGY